MIELYGVEEVESLKEKSRKGFPLTGFELRQMIIEYRQKIKLMKAEKDL